VNADFSISQHPLDITPLREALSSPDCGGFVHFEGRVRNHHSGRAVTALRYEAYRELAEKEGAFIVAEISRKHGVKAAAVHAVGDLRPGDLAVWVGAAAAHREAAFAACRELIDAIKDRVPVWKHETYADGKSSWIAGCDHAAAANPDHQ
jgi:molybdopterin synthase catalytic subunit